MAARTALRLQQPPRSPEREQLAQIITRRDELSQRRAAIEAAIENTRRDYSARFRAVEAARDEVEKAKTAMPAYLIDAALGGCGPAPPSLKETRALAADAEDALTATEAAQTVLKAQLEQARSGEALAAARVTEALRNVVKADPAVHKLLDDYAIALRTLVSLRRPLDVPPYGYGYDPYPYPPAYYGGYYRPYYAPRYYARRYYFYR